MNRRHSPRRKISRGRVTEAQLKTIARSIAKEFQAKLRQLDLWEHREDPRAWRRLVRFMGYTVHSYKRQSGAGPGYADIPAGKVIYEEASDLLEECHRIVHELVHLVLIDHGIGQARRLERFDDSIQSQQHRAARMVEEILFGEE